MWCNTQLLNLEINFNLVIRHCVNSNEKIIYFLSITISLKPTYEYHQFHGLITSTWDLFIGSEKT